jgi:hypothetical protein
VAFKKTLKQNETEQTNTFTIYTSLKPYDMYIYASTTTTRVKIPNDVYGFHVLFPFISYKVIDMFNGKNEPNSAVF